MANLKLLDVSVAHNVLQLVSLEGPHSVGILCAMLCDYLAIQFIELNEVGPSQHEVFKKLGPFYLCSIVT